MKTSPMVSVLMPAHNAQKFIDESIQSIINQTYLHWELLVCDDASSDLTYEIIKKYGENEPRIKIFRNTVNLKLLQTRNNLIAASRGDLITFQDADDFSDTSRLEKMVREFQSNPRLGLLSSQVGYVSKNGNLLRISKKPTDYKTTLELMYSENVVGGSIMMISREALDSVGGQFRAYFDGLSYQDYDLSLLIAEKYECYGLSDVLYFYRQHNNSSSKMISVDRLVAKGVVQYLALQRKKSGFDDLMVGHEERVNEYFDRLRQPYIKDPSLVFRDFAANFMYNQLNIRAIETAWIAVRRRPFTRINWGILQYCIRKTLMNKCY